MSYKQRVMSKNSKKEFQPLVQAGQGRMLLTCGPCNSMSIPSLKEFLVKSIGKKWTR